MPVVAPVERQRERWIATNQNGQVSRHAVDLGVHVFADSSTWADDERSVEPETADWHFIDILRGAPRGNLAQYCSQSTGCVTKAISDQLAILRDPKASARARADALRYVIHFVGDLHQPLHTTTNDDRGGNCVPVTSFDHNPKETNATRADYRPNLHSVWDPAIIEQWADGHTPQQLANELENKFKAQIPAWESQPINVDAWAWESHEVAERVVYGNLPTELTVEKPVQVRTCADDDHISTRMLKLNEQIGANYDAEAGPVIQEQLAKAGVRLAAVLNSVWK